MREFRESYEQRKKRRRMRRIRSVVILVILAILAAGSIWALHGREENSAPKDETRPEVLKGEERTGDSKENKVSEPERFSSVYYYDADKEERYRAYQALHPEFAEDEVVWRVDAGLDQPFYGEISEISDISVKPLVPNKYRKLPDSFVPEHLVKFPSGRQVTADTKAAYDRLQADASKQNLRISEGSAYRSINYQKEVYARYLKKDSQEVVDTYSSRPGHSDHHTGEAIDLMARDGSLTGFEGTQEAAWIEENAYRYGFIIRFPKGEDDVTGYVYEPWHIRYVGTEIAQRMHDEGIRTLEEYQVKYMDHTPPKE